MDIPIILAASHHMMVAPIKDMFAKTSMPSGVQFVVKTLHDLHLRQMPDWSDVNESDMKQHAHKIARCIWMAGFCAMADCTRLITQKDVATYRTVVAFIDRLGTPYYSEASLCGKLQPELSETDQVPSSSNALLFVPDGQDGKSPLALEKTRLEMVAIFSHWGKAYRKILTDHKFKILDGVLKK